MWEGMRVELARMVVMDTKVEVDWSCETPLYHGLRPKLSKLLGVLYGCQDIATPNGSNL